MMAGDRLSLRFAREAAATASLAVALIGGSLATAGEARAQLGPAPISSGVDRTLPAPYEDPARAVRLLDDLRRAHPGRIDLHLDAAREHAVLGVLGDTRDERLMHLRASEEAARAAVALEPARADAHYWLAAALGMQADEEGGLTKISKAREAYRVAVGTLELDPDHAGAHHIVGRLHVGARRLGWADRLIARGLGLGEILDQASWESAERHLRLAVEGDPRALLHRVDLAKLLARRSRPDEARVILTEVASREPRHALEAHHRELAVRLLEDGLPEG